MNRLKILAIVAFYLTLSMPIARAENIPVDVPGDITGDVPRIMVTIKPIHAIVSALLEDINQPELLLDGLYSPHTYHLRPSDARRLNQADMIIWVGPALESRLRKIINQQRGRSLIITLSDLLHTNSHTGPHADKPLLLHEQDPHLWLDPQLVIKLAEYLRQSLISIMPGYIDKINHNAKRLSENLAQLDKQIENRFIDQKQISAIVYHDAWHYFERRYGLTTDGIISTHEQQQPGTAHLYALQKIIKAQNTQCLFIEPQFKPRYLNILNTEKQLKIITTDPLGASIEAGPEAYFTLMRNIAEAFQQCLKN